MDTRQKAIQAAMAAEIGARLGRMHKSDRWLQQQAGIKPASWRRYFREYSRDLPLSVVAAIAPVLDMTAGELLTIAERDAPLFASQVMNVSAAEAADLDKAVRRNGHSKPESTNDDVSARTNTGT